MNTRINLIYGVNFSVPETAGSPVPDGMQRFHYSTWCGFTGKRLYDASIDCQNEKIFGEWLWMANEDFNHNKRYIYTRTG